MAAATAVLPRSGGRLPAFAVFVVALLMPVAPIAQASAVLAGIVSDSSGAALPGVKVTVTTTNLERSAVTDDQGRYQVAGLPAGTYTVKAELPGFETVVDHGVVVAAEAAPALNFTLKVGCLSEVVWVDFGMPWALREANAIVHIRIAGSGSGERCIATGLCVCTEHVAVVMRDLKADQPDAAPTSIRFLQDGAGRITGMAPSGSKPYAPGEEYIAFLRWDSAARRFVRILGDGYMFPVRGGRVQFSRTDAPGLSDGMPVEEFGRALRALMTSTR